MNTRSGKRRAAPLAPAPKRTKPESKAPAPKRASSSSAGASGSSTAAVKILKTFHGQVRHRCGMGAPGSGMGISYWKSMFLTTQEDLNEFTDSINDRTYSMTAGKGGAKFDVPLKRVKLKSQAVVVIIDGSPFSKNGLTIERRGPGTYAAHATLLEKRMGSTPSGLVSYDAFLFNLAADDGAATMTLTGAGAHCGDRPLPSEPVWER